MTMRPPPASAHRRAMSSPSPDDPRSDAAAHLGRFGDPRPVVGDVEPGAVRLGGQRDGERGALLGVRHDVLQQRIDRGGEVLGGRADRHGAVRTTTVLGRPCSSMSGDQNSTRSRTTSAASQEGNRPSRCGRRAARITAVSMRSSSLTRRPEALSLGRVAQRLGLEPQRRQRRAQPVRQVGNGLALFHDQLIDPVGEPVQRRRRRRRPPAARRSARGP